ncbi:hypothetical protein D3C77_592700 [compost metagenome]
MTSASGVLSNTRRLSFQALTSSALTCSGCPAIPLRTRNCWPGSSSATVSEALPRTATLPSSTVTCTSCSFRLTLKRVPTTRTVADPASIRNGRYTLGETSNSAWPFSNTT